MYEYVQTANGWVLCWGGSFLYRDALERLRATPVVESRPAPETDGMEAEPATAQAA